MSGSDTGSNRSGCDVTESDVMASHEDKLSGHDAGGSDVDNMTDRLEEMTSNDVNKNVDRTSVSSGRSEASNVSRHSGSGNSNGLDPEHVNGHNDVRDSSASDSDNNDREFESADTLERPSQTTSKDNTESTSSEYIHATHHNIDKPSKKKNPFKFLRRLTSKSDSKNKDSGAPVAAQSDEGHNMDKSLMNIQIDSLPQVFVTKYMGSKPCQGLWGIKHTRGPVEELIQDVTGLDPDIGEDLPLVQLRVSEAGLHIREHSANACKTRRVEKELIPIEFISYGVQDVKYTRIFAFILVREMSSRSRKLECHSYVCDSSVNCRRLSLSVAFAFQEYSKNLEGKPYKFQVDLKTANEQEELAKETAHGGEDFEA